MTNRHFIIPDTQVRSGVPTDHLYWVAEAIKEYKPTTVVHLGDHWDFPSISRHSNPGTLEKENARLMSDFVAGNVAMEALHPVIHNGKFRSVFLMGNHERRLHSFISQNPVLEGAFDGELNLSCWREIVEYDGHTPGQIEIDGVTYGHYFANPLTGKPISGSIQNRLNKIGTSFVQGHQQGLLQGSIQLATGRIRHGIMAGSCYLHDEEYKGVSNSHWRGVVVLNEVRAGEFCEMPLSLDYLCRKYEGVPLSKFLTKKYKGATQKYSLARKDSTERNGG